MPAFTQDADLHYQSTTCPGARLPHAWVYDAQGGKHSTLDLAGGGAFTLFTGLGGQDWADTAQGVAEDLGITLRVHIIGPRQEFIDHTGDWARMREIGDAGFILTRPDQHVCWRQESGVDDPAAELRRVLGAVLGK